MASELRDELKRLEMEAASIAADLCAIAEDAERALAAPSPAAVKESLTTDIDEVEDILRATLSEHGVRSDGEAKALAGRVRDTLRSAMQAATCNQPLQVHPEDQAGADDSHYSVIFEAVKASVREIASSRGWQSLGLRDQEYIAGRVMRDLAVAVPKPAEGGADEPFAYVDCEGLKTTSCAELVWPWHVGKGKRGAKVPWSELPPGLHALYLKPKPAAPAGSGEGE